MKKESPSATSDEPKIRPRPMTILAALQLARDTLSGVHAPMAFVDGCPECKQIRELDLLIMEAKAQRSETKPSLQEQIDFAVQKEACRWAERLNWIHAKYDVDGSGTESGDALDVIEDEIQQAFGKLEEGVTPSARALSQKVYAVLGGWDYEGNAEPTGIYSTREKAEAAMIHARQNHSYDDLDIYEYDLDRGEAERG